MFYSAGGRSGRGGYRLKRNARRKTSTARRLEARERLVGDGTNMK
jgi:hypothetical protein